MFRRMFWFFTGAAAGVWATTKVNRAVRRLSPEGLAATAADKALETGARLRLFAQDVRAGMTEREIELKDALGLEAAEPELPGQRRRPALGTGQPHPKQPYKTYKQSQKQSHKQSYNRKDDH
ncbi:DUF6167 family protein [Streptomyces sp. H10-C2]|uniref:DUF6167 family protein n=1 Tax=unclassified Streptomyces TaxID=2593676 RepID=UPI0024B9FAC8|nr:MULTISPECIES: DUF6167 family protein [unclassified Streptomyces]MDJ0345270.1 DUF6167 family protein [Streptomyces sp. PH10-H1]MDJ0370721.1 DUF6167 family protein [Streptomyces sp. H10-C2]